MGKTLVDKLISGAKITGAAILTTAIISSSALAGRKTPEKLQVNYWKFPSYAVYLTEKNDKKRNIKIETQSRKAGNKIKYTGQPYPLATEDESNGPENSIGILINRWKNYLGLTYIRDLINRGPDEMRELAEDQNNTYVYIVLPYPTKIKGEIQSIEITKGVRYKHKDQYVLPPDRNRIKKAIGVLPVFFNPLIEQENSLAYRGQLEMEKENRMQEVRRLSDSALEYLKEEGVSSTRPKRKKGIIARAREKGRRNSMAKKYGPKYQIIKIDFFQPQKDMSEYYTTGRAFQLELENDKDQAPIFIEIPELTFTERKGKSRTGRKNIKLRNLSFEISP